MSFDFDRTSKNAFGETTFYKNGKKVGRSSSPIFGSSTIYDNKGKRIGSSRDVGFGRTEYRNAKGKNMGYSSSLFGSSSHYGADGKHKGSSMDNPFVDESGSSGAFSFHSTVSANTYFLASDGADEESHFTWEVDPEREKEWNRQLEENRRKMEEAQKEHERKEITCMLVIVGIAIILFSWLFSFFVGG